MIGIILALLSAATSGLSVVLVRKHSNESTTFNISLIVTMVGTAVLWPLALVVSDFSLMTLEGFLLFAISGVLSPGLVRLFYYKGLKTLGVSGNSAIFAVYPLYSAFLAIVFLSEILLAWNWAGILFIIIGVVVLDLSMHVKNSKGYSSRKNLVFPIIGGITLGISSVIRKYALDICNTPVLGVAIAYVFSLLPFLMLAVFSFSTRKELSLKRDMKWFWIAGVGQAMTWMLAFYALSYNQVSIVTPLLSIEPLFVAVFAYFYLKNLEKISTKLLIGMIITVIGVVLVTL